MDKIAMINQWCQEHRLKVTSKHIVQAVLDVYLVNEEDLKSRNTKEACMARNCIVWFIKKLTRLSFERTAVIVHRSMASTMNQKNKMLLLVNNNDEDAIDALWEVYLHLKKQYHNQLKPAI